MKKNNNPALYEKTWDEVRAELFTPEEIAESDLRVYQGTPRERIDPKGTGRIKRSKAAGNRKAGKRANKPAYKHAFKSVSPLGQNPCYCPFGA